MLQLRQLYDESGQPIEGKAETKEKVFQEGLLHGAAHVWVWRKVNSHIDVLLQMRSATKTTWPNILDVSAAGHIDLDETPRAAALRETREELGLRLSDTDLQLAFQHRWHVTLDNGLIENEFRWIYSYKLEAEVGFNISTAELDSIQWKTLQALEHEVFDPELKNHYVPQGDEYFRKLIDYLRQQA